MPESIQVTAVELNQAISRHEVFKLIPVTIANLLGICKSSYRPTQKSRKSARRVTRYCITTPGIKPSEMPGGNSKWYTSC
jgi:hypothetical protein